MWSIWEEPRIKVNMSDSNNIIKLPSITKTEQVVWSPFTASVIIDMKEMKPLYDPIIARELRLLSGRTVNGVLSKEVFFPNTTLIATNPKWIVKIFCDFDFSTYPFDNQKCAFKMISENVNVTLHERPSYYNKLFAKEKDEFDGYAIQRELVWDSPKWSPLYQAKTSTYGVIFKMRRQIEPYIYKYYVPCNALVITSFFSFMIPMTAGRVAVVVTPLLTVTNIFVHHMVRT